MHRDGKHEAGGKNNNNHCDFSTYLKSTVNMGIINVDITESKNYIQFATYAGAFHSSIMCGRFQTMFGDLHHMFDFLDTLQC